MFPARAMSNAERRKPYPFDQLEPKWQTRWAAEKTFHALNPGDPGFDPARPKFYVLDMFPYPSGSGLHVGHPVGYLATDMLARYKKMRGFNVLHPMGWDAFGLPAEQYAIKTGEHPRVTTARNVAVFKSQLTRLGLAYDWSREINTTDPGYFRWTQWIFLQLYHAWFNPATNRAEPIATYSGGDPDAVRLAYVSEAPVNWCQALGTVLANEEVIDGRSEVGGHPVERRPMLQWKLRITAFAHRLLDELDGLDWPESIKALQRNWIGRSEGAEVAFRLAAMTNDGMTNDERTGDIRHSSFDIRVFTTRPDTLYGATYMVLAPEHPLIDRIATEDQRPAVREYREKTARKSDLDRTELAKDKTGVFTGAFAINPVNGERIPMWIADYVLPGYGTGAIMAVPAHDERDWEFARKFALPIREVVSPEPRLGLGGESPCSAEPLECYIGEGFAIHSGPLDGLPTSEAKAEITRRLEALGLGKKTITYKLRDWLFSRQRYWGEPFPIVWEEGKHRAIEGWELPLIPPELEDFKPTGTGEPPLAKATEWLRYSDKATRETNTMPQWAGSCWYYLRYCDPLNATRFVGRDAERYWTGAADGRDVAVVAALRGLWREADSRQPGPLRLHALCIGRLDETEAAALSAATGMELSGYAHYADNQSFRHIQKKHGSESGEAKRGQLAITEEDVALIPEIVRHPDEVRSGSPTGRGRPAILYSKRINGWVIYVEESLVSQRRLLIKTMYKKAATGKRATAEAGFAHTSETFRRAQTFSSRKPAPVKGGVDLYVGGTEHAVLHLLYARFWHKALFDLGHVSTPEPFQRLVNQGLMLGEDGQKMSKSRGNVVNPDEVIAEYGADALRCYEMFMGPLEQTKPWSMTGVEGVARFLARVWRLAMEENQAGEWVVSAAVQDIECPRALAKVMHATIKKVGEDLEALSFNTAIAQMMIFTNALTAAAPRPLSAVRALLLVLNSFAPHLAEELWERLGTGEMLARQPWPAFDPALLIEDEIELPVQVNGKVRDKIVVKKDATAAEIEAAALAAPRIVEHTAGKSVKKIVVVPGRLVNIVAG